MTTAKHPVLLVDDEPDILFSLRGLLRQEFELHTAASGAEALAELRQHDIHVVLTDQRMPQMSGAELLGRAREEFPRAVRLLFTGYADIRAVIDAINQGHVYRYLTKPWDPDDLCAALHEACAIYERDARRRQLLTELRDHVSRCQELLRDRADAAAVQAVADGAALLARLEQAITGLPGLA